MRAKSDCQGSCLPESLRNKYELMTTPAHTNEDSWDFLLSHSDEGTVNKVELQDSGSDPKCVSILLHGVLATGLVDSGADITIMGEIFSNNRSCHQSEEARSKKDCQNGKDLRPTKFYVTWSIRSEY